MDDPEIAGIVAVDGRARPGQERRSVRPGRRQVNRPKNGLTNWTGSNGWRECWYLSVGMLTSHWDLYRVSCSTIPSPTDPSHAPSSLAPSRCAGAVVTRHVHCIPRRTVLVVQLMPARRSSEWLIIGLVTWQVTFYVTAHSVHRQLYWATCYPTNSATYHNELNNN